MECTEKPASVRVTGEANSLVAEWSHDVCRFLLKWLKLSPLNSFQEAAKTKSTTDTGMGMPHIYITLILQVFQDLKSVNVSICITLFFCMICVLRMHTKVNCYTL